MTAPVSEDVNQTLKESTMNQQEKAERFTELMTRFTSVLGKILPDDVATRLAELRKEQTSDISRIVYDAMFDDLAAARRLNVPLCQDTGVIQYYIEVGANFPLLSEMRACLDEAVRRATIEAPLRQNAVQIFDERNTGNNTGVRVPWIDWEIIPDSDSCLIHGYMGIVKFIFDVICDRGVNACPPLLVGIGIAGSVEVAAELSKKALMRPVGSKNANEIGADFEKMIEEGLNKINIGPGGLTGTKSVMGVNVEQAARHPSCLAVGVSTGCWGHRRATIRINADMSYEMISHKGMTL